MTDRVLVIDDSLDIHSLLAVRLRPEAVELSRATTATEGLAAAREASPDLILLDVDLAGECGFEVCRALKADPTTSSIPVIFLTGYADVQAKVRGFELGAVDYVTKPFEPTELRVRVRAALRTKRRVDLLATRAQVDGLTGLWNRAFFDRRLAEEVELGRRHGRRVSLVLFDLDHFKQINDRYGHPFGDRVLQTVGEALVAALRTTDVACRYGGEEFALVLPDDSSGAAEATERVRSAFAARSLPFKQEAVRFTASFGIAGNDLLESATAAELLEAADQALYASKAAGRDRKTVASPSATSAPAPVCATASA